MSVNSVQPGWLVLAGLALGAIVAATLWRRVVPDLLARFDQQVLHTTPVDADAPPYAPHTPAERICWDRLYLWCHNGIGDGHAPLWAPWRPPQIETRFTIATLRPEGPTACPALLQHLANHLDGSLLLAQMESRLQRLLYRLQVKWWDVQWWRRRQPGDPWDCGHLQPQVSVAALQAFRPRRPTLILGEGLPPEVLVCAATTLQAQSTLYRQPVRLLVTDPGARATLEQAGVRGAVVG